MRCQKAKQIELLLCCCSRRSLLKLLHRSNAGETGFRGSHRFVTICRVLYYFSVMDSAPKRCCKAVSWIWKKLRGSLFPHSSCCPIFHYIVITLYANPQCDIWCFYSSRAWNYLYVAIVSASRRSKQNKKQKTEEVRNAEMVVWSGIPFYSQENCRMEILDAVICSLSRSSLSNKLLCHR